MVETANTEEFTTGAVRRKPENFEFVKFRIDDGVARLTLNRPDHNLLNEAMLREIADGIVFAGERDDVKLIAIDSACKVFSGGVDIGEYTTQRVYQMLDAFHAAFAGMLEVSKPVLCVVNGPAISSLPRRKLASRNPKSPSACFLPSPPRSCLSSSGQSALSKSF
jgi:1,4-dihydroxy-2-naphthoyl-CoA synthase